MSLSCLTLALLLLVFFDATSARLPRPFVLEVHRDNVSHRCSFLSMQETQLHKSLLDNRNGLVVSDEGMVYNGDGVPTSNERYLQFYSHDGGLLWEKAESLCGSKSTWTFPTHIATPRRSTFSEGGQETFQTGVENPISSSSLPKPPVLEIIPLITSGESSNRIDMVFFSDGYTDAERNKFIQDSKSLANDMSNNQTFATVKPLLNFWAAFAASNESGIGVGGKPKDTPFGLYRDGTELRGVYYSKPRVAQAACLSMDDACDYPILLGNDPLYGGLGGRFTVTTSSTINGPLVLRHELGHSVIKEGEEYDGGFAYYGPNAAQNLSEPFPWAHWLTEPAASPRAERSVMPIQAYPWTMLNLSSPWTVSFNSSGMYCRHVVRFSLSGIPEKHHLTVKLDGEDIGWSPRSGIGLDRWHYDIHQNSTLSGGEHSITFSLQKGAMEGAAQLCSVEVIEFGDWDEFDATEGFIGAFPTFSEKNKTTYRPSNEDCLMRIVTSPNFCSVCVEGLWHVLLKRVDLIDDFWTGCAVGMSGEVQRFFETKLLKIGQFRESGTNHREAYSISWKKDGELLPEHANKTHIEVPNDTGTFAVEVQFVTDEVRVDPHKFLTASSEIEINARCMSV